MSMTVEEAVEYLKRADTTVGQAIKTRTAEALEMAIKALEIRWIPVSERLPEEFESVLVCYKSQGGMAYCISERLVNMDGSNRWSAMCGQEPIAWMPIPALYEEESEEM